MPYLGFYLIFNIVKETKWNLIVPKNEGFFYLRTLAFVFNIPVGENQDCQLSFLHKQET